jgi:Flp pilus assembly protein TadD
VSTYRSIAGSACIALLVACAGPLERGERLYRQGDLAGARQVWREVPETHGDHPEVQKRLEVIDAAFDRALLRYEKQAAFFETEDRLAESVLYYRLAYKLDSSRDGLLDRIQRLSRELKAQEDAEKRGLAAALRANDLEKASRHATALARLNPFDPGLQTDVRQVRAGIDEQVEKHLERGKAAYAAGQRGAARNEFMTVLALDPRNETALGYLSYIHRFDQFEANRRLPPPPGAVSRKEILAEGHYRSAQQAEAADEPFWAITEYQAALGVDPNHNAARRDLARLRRRMKPQVDDLYALGKHYFQEEDLHNALRAWRRVLLIEPDDKRTREHVERAERMLARLEEIQTSGS